MAPSSSPSCTSGLSGQLGLSYLIQGNEHRPPYLASMCQGEKTEGEGKNEAWTWGRSFFLAGGGSLPYLDNTSLPPKHQPNTLELGGGGKPGPPSASNCISLPRFLSRTRAIKHFCRQQTFPTTFTYHHFHHPHLPNLTIHQRRKPSPLHPFAQHSISTPFPLQ